VIHQLHKFRVIIIDYPIYGLEDPFCAKLLGRALKMKHEGYVATYGDNSLPMDKTDFFATHLLLCEEKDDDLWPVIAYKSVSFDRCLFYGAEFPGTSLMKSDGHPSCVAEIDRIIAAADSPGTISFDSSWAQALSYRFSGNAPMKRWLREVVTMMAVRHHEDYGLPHFFTCGVVQVHTDQFFRELGLRELNDRAHFFQKNLNGAEAVIFYNDRFSPEAHALASKHQALWDARLEIKGLDQRERKNSAA
jgi:hypothetical protein